MAIDFAHDPVLALADHHADAGEFRAFIAAAVRRHPGTLEANANADEAAAQLAEAKQRRLPSGDLTISNYQVLAREFSNDPNNIIERSRAHARTDGDLSITGTLFDAGAGLNRQRAAGARLRAAEQDADATIDQEALGAIGAWYDVYDFRTLVALTRAYIDSQLQLREAVQSRIASGASAPGDLARVDSYIAGSRTKLAGVERQLANAEARFFELAGAPAPAGIDRGPTPAMPLLLTRDAAVSAAASTPAARAAQALADAARSDVKAAKADRWPTLGAGLDAGRYGIFETQRDYDIRGSVIFRQHLFGGIDARAKEAEARANAATAHADRIRIEAERDAAIASSDVIALEAQLEALRQSYIAGRQSRDVLLQRFLNSRGTLFDVIAAEDTYFATATEYVRGLSELDAARYVLLARTGRITQELGIDTTRGTR